MDQKALWVEAAIEIAKNPTARVLCPARQDADLIVTDQYFPDEPTLRVRHMRCPKCGAYNELRLHRKLSEEAGLIGATT